MPPAKRATKVTKKTVKKVSKKISPEMTGDEIKKFVVEQTLAYPSGCFDGKLKFLESLGLEVPTKTIKYEVVVEFKPGAEAMAEEIEAYLESCADEECYDGETETYVYPVASAKVSVVE